MILTENEQKLLFGRFIKGLVDLIGGEETQDRFTIGIPDGEVTITLDKNTNTPDNIINIKDYEGRD